MQSPEVPNDEQARLAALHETGLLFSAPEYRFDRITRLARQMFNVEVVLISLVAEEVQWFKSRQGLDIDRTERRVSICAHAINHDEIFLLENAALDSRFCDNPLVQGDLHIRFYAGAPLRVEKGGENHKIGTLCLIDSSPRQFSASDQEQLRDLADLVELELRQVRLEEQLARAELAEQRLSWVIEGTHIGTWEWHVQTGETVFNERWAEIVGYTLNELAPVSIDTWTGLAHPDDLEESGRALQAHFDGTTEFYDVRCRMRHKDGHWVWVHDRGRLVSRTPEGEPLLMAGTHADISEQVGAQHALRQSEARLRGLFELAPYGIALNDFETGAFLDMNPALLAPTGYSQDEFTGLSYWEVTPEEYAPQEELQLQSMRATGRYGPYEKEYIRKDGTRYPVLLNGMIVQDENGRELIWSIVENISERKRMEKLKDEFVAVVSHELRTPLTALRGALSLIGSGVVGVVPKGVGDLVKVAEKNSQRLQLLINDLLDMEKLLAGKMRLDVEWHSIAEQVESALSENQPYAAAYQVSLNYRNWSSGAEIAADGARLQQVLANLLSNAIKFSSSGGEVEVTSELEGDMVRISVQDQGPGIAPEFHAFIFQKFSQADASDARQRGGTGLGLAITRELVQNMGGSISFSSQPGKGACFFFKLPARVSPESGPKPC